MQLAYVTTLLDSMKPASLNVLVLVPLGMTKFRRYSVFSLSKLWVIFIKNNAGFEGLVVLFKRKKLRSIHADYVIHNIPRKMLMAKKHTYEKNNDGPMKSL